MTLPLAPIAQPFDPDPTLQAQPDQALHVVAADQPPMSGFEGPEKRLEIQFRPAPHPHTSTPARHAALVRLTDIAAQDWQQQMLDHAKCTIISSTCNKYFNSYVLSESSLFVYPDKVMIKTCGTTLLLNAVEPLLRIARERCGLVPGFVVYSRKNYVFPDLQPDLHRRFDTEVSLLDRYFSDAGGTGYIIGPLSSDRWHMYLADYSGGSGISSSSSNADDASIADNNSSNNSGGGNNNNNMKDDSDETMSSSSTGSSGGSSTGSGSWSSSSGGMTVEVLMHDLSMAKMKHFFKKWQPADWTSDDVTRASGVDTILPGSVIDAFQFDPCGYSMNGLLQDAYWTIHVTPEPGFSFVSFETNVSERQLAEVGHSSYAELLARVLHVFEPGRFTVTMFSDNHQQQRQAIEELTSRWRSAERDFKLRSKCTTEFPEEGYSLTWACFTQRCRPSISLNTSMSVSSVSSLQQQ